MICQRDNWMRLIGALLQDTKFTSIGSSTGSVIMGHSNYSSPKREKRFQYISTGIDCYFEPMLFFFLEEFFKYRSKYKVLVVFPS